MLPLLLLTDVFTIIIPHCKFPTLVALANTSTLLRGIVVAFLRRQVQHVLSAYFPDASGTVKIMRNFNILLSGSTALKLVLCMDATTWNAHDIDLYCPKSAATPFLSYVESQGYVIQNSNSDYIKSYWPQPEDVHNVYQGERGRSIDTVHRLQND
jgi:hypothetical protein